MDRCEDLRSLTTSPDPLPAVLQDLFESDELADLATVAQVAERQRQQFAAVYLRLAEECKGEHAFALEQYLRTLKPASGVAATAIICPDYIRRAIEWVTPGAVDHPTA